MGFRVMRALDPDAIVPWLASAFRRGLGKDVLAGVMRTPFRQRSSDGQ